MRNAVEVEIATLPDAQLVEIQMDTSNSTIDLNVTARASRQPTYKEVVAMQEVHRHAAAAPGSSPARCCAHDRARPAHPAHLHFHSHTRSDKHQHAHADADANCHFHSHANPSLHIDTNSNAYPYAHTHRNPDPARIDGTGGRGVFLRQTPGGDIVPGVVISEGATIYLLYQQETLNGVEWVEVRDEQGRQGWVREMFVVYTP